METQTNQDDASHDEIRTKDGSLHDRFNRGIVQNEAFSAYFYRKILGAPSFVQNVDVRSFKAINGELITHKMKARIADGFFRLEYVDKSAPERIHTRPVLVEYKFHKDPSTWIQVGEYVFVYLRDIVRAIKADPRLRRDYCVGDSITAPTVIVFYCGFEPWNFEKEKIQLAIPPELEEFKIDFRCEFVSIRELNADDFNDSPVIKTLILLWQAVANPQTRKEDAERVFAPVFDGDEFEQWYDVLSFCLIYWVEALETRGIHLTSKEVCSLFDRIKDGNLRKEVRMFAEIYAADIIEKFKAETEQARGEIAQARGEAEQARGEAEQARKQAQDAKAQALARERAAEERAAQYQRELVEARQQMAMQMAKRQDEVFWTALSARFPSTTIATADRIRQIQDYSQKLFGDVLTATSLEDFTSRLDTYLAKP